jgi:hypothetical protein
LIIPPNTIVFRWPSWDKPSLGGLIGAWCGGKLGRLSTGPTSPQPSENMDRPNGVLLDPDRVIKRITRQDLFDAPTGNPRPRSRRLRWDSTIPGWAVSSARLFIETLCVIEWKSGAQLSVFVRRRARGLFRFEKPDRRLLPSSPDTAQGRRHGGQTALSRNTDKGRSWARG